MRGKLEQFWQCRVQGHGRDSCMNMKEKKLVTRTQEKREWQQEISIKLNNPTIM